MSLSSRITALAALAVVGTAAPAPAALFFFTDRAAFDAAAPGLPVETFEEARLPLPPNPPFVAFTGPLNSATNNGVFLPGEILPGLSVSTTPIGVLTDLIVIGPGAVPGISRVVGANLAQQVLTLSFAPGVGAVGFDLFGSPGPGTIAPATFDVSVSGAGGLLGTTVVSSTAAQPIIFFGVLSDDVRITQVTVNARGTFEFVDNVAFGVPAVPEPASAGLLAAGAAAVGFRRRRAAA